MVNAIAPANSNFGFDNQELAVGFVGSDCDTDNQALVNDEPTFEGKIVDEIDSEESDKTPEMNVCEYGWTWIEPTWTFTYERTDIH